MVELAVGCKVIITTSIDTDMDMSNGVWGQVVHIWADPQEPAGNGESLVHDMQYPPACMFIKMERFRLGEVVGMEVSTYPIFPVVKKVEYITAKGQRSR